MNQRLLAAPGASSANGLSHSTAPLTDDPNTASAERFGVFQASLKSFPASAAAPPFDGLVAAEHASSVLRTLIRQ